MATTRYNFKLSPDAAISIEADTQADAFKQWASAYEIFGFTQCPDCRSDVYPRVRVVDENSYHEICCTSPKCGRALSLGQKKKGGSLFPKRKDKDGKYLDFGGFVRWQGTPRNDDGGDDDEEVTTSKPRSK